MSFARSGRRLAASTVVAALVAAPALAAEGAFTPGAPGIGDPYFSTMGNGGYDVEHYDVAVRYTLSTGRLAGRTAVTAQAKHGLSRFNLDLALGARAVSVDGRPATYSQARRELTVTPAVPISAGRTFTVVVDYAGQPADVRVGGTSPWVSSEAEAMATNEPHIGPWWFAGNDHPRDKATFDISVTVPTGQQAISNGDHLGVTSAPGWDTWSWRVVEPMTTYLAFFAAGRFEIESGVAAGLPYFIAVSTALAPSNRTAAMNLMRRSPGVVRWLETQLGDYPFTSTGGVTTSLYAGFALENQTRPTYPFLGNGRYGRDTVVHELAHQWFGDHVAVDRWRDIWLNEGFATWFEWRYAETHGGTRAQRALMSRYRGYGAGDPLWDLSIGNPGKKHLFAYAVYERGAMAVQALRHRIGTPAFKQLLRRWVSEQASGNGRVGEFKSLAEEVSGEQLDGFFDAWLATGRKPARTAANGLR